MGPGSTPCQKPIAGGGCEAGAQPRPAGGRSLARILGNTRGLKTSQLKKLERIYRRRIPNERVASFDLVRELAARSRELGRRLGVLLDRSGGVSHVFLGDAKALPLPELELSSA